ncbi:MAG: alpha/beta hydrolase [Lachnospiraceae bacterium]|nr:alpha/beta hydrolase [Lachnospiraceae bacterium]
MTREFRKLIDAAKEEMSKNAHGMRAANKMVPVSGQRHKLPLEGREVEIVLYPALNDDGSKMEGKQPLIVGFHGGGFIFGGCALDDDMWVAVTKTMHVNVASVDYRMSPDHKWKETFLDSYEVLLYLAEHAEEFGFDGDHISVMGQSAGGNLAASVSLWANLKQSIKLDNVVLVYPFLDVYTDPDSKGSGSLTGPMTYAMNELHCDFEDTLNPLVSPVFAESSMLKGLPNTIFDYSEDDNLRFEGMKYAEKLKEAGVPVSENLSEGMPHGFFESGFKTPTEFEMNNLLGEKGPQIVADGSLARKSQEALDFINGHFVR